MSSKAASRSTKKSYSISEIADLLISLVKDEEDTVMPWGVKFGPRTHERETINRFRRDPSLENLELAIRCLKDTSWARGMDEGEYNASE